MDLLAADPRRRRVGRLYKRLVLKDRLAQEVRGVQTTRELGSEFTVEVTAAEGVDLERIKRVVLEELERLKSDGPTEAEVARVKAAGEAALPAPQGEPASAAPTCSTRLYRAYGGPTASTASWRARLRPTEADLAAVGPRASSARAAWTCASCRRARRSTAAALDKRPADLPDGRGRGPPRSTR